MTTNNRCFSYRIFFVFFLSVDCMLMIITMNKVITMSESIREFMLTSNKWKNIEYDFSSHSNNCTLNIDIGYIVKFTKLTKSLFEIQSNYYYNIFVPLISQATKCKIFISNFNYEQPEIAILHLQKVFINNVCLSLLLYY